MNARATIRFAIFILSILWVCSALAQEPGTVKWEWDQPEEWGFDTAPAISRDGTIYGADQLNYLNAINPDGTLKWRYRVDRSFDTSSPAIAPDGTVIIADEGHTVYAFNPDGTVKWTFAGPEGQEFASTAALGPDGTIYLGSADSEIDNIFALNPDGTVRWSAEASIYVTSSPAVASDGTIYVAGGTESLDAFHPDGSPAWSYPMGTAGASSSMTSSPAIGPDGAIYLGGGDWDDPALFAINPDGTLRWRYDASSLIYSTPAIGPDGTIYVGDEGSDLNAVNPDGTLKWSYSASGGMSSSPAIGSDGTIYVGSHQWLNAINPDGTLQWRYPDGVFYYNSPVIGQDGTVYSAGNRKLFAFHSSSDGPADTSWPMFRQNTRHTGMWEQVVTPLTLGDTVAASIPPNGVHYYSLETDADESLLVELDPGGGVTSLILTGQLGATTYSSSVLTPNGVVELLIAPTAEAEYLLSVFGNEVATNGGAYTLTANYMYQHLSDIDPRSAGNAGEVSLAITGLGFETPMQVELSGPATIPVAEVTVSSESQLLARFDLTGAALGFYDVTVTWPDTNWSVLAGAFEVVAGVGPELEAELEAPEGLRAERRYVVWLEYANVGDADLPAPLFTVRGNVPVSLDRDDITQNRVEVLGTGSQSSPNILRPGESRRIPLYFVAPSSGAAEFSLSETLDTGDAIDWASLKDGMRPPDMDLSEWNALWPDLVTRLGTTWSDYLQVLRDDSSRIGRRGQTAHDVALLTRLEMRLAASLPVAAVSGVLLHADTNVPLQGVTLRLRNADGSVVKEQQTSYTPPGQFAFTELPDDTYEIWVDGYFFDPPVTAVVVGGDVWGLELFANESPVEPELTAPDAPQHSPRVTTDGAGNTYLVWQENDQILWAADAGSGWTQGDEISDALGSRPMIVYDAGLLDDGASPGLLVLWETTGSPRVLQWSVGRIETGSVSWSEPQDLTFDVYDDTAPALLVDSSHQAMVVWLQADFSIEDDTDLYFLEYDPEAGAVWSTMSDDIPWTTDSTAVCVVHGLANGTGLPRWVPVIGGNYGFSVAGEICSSEASCEYKESGEVTAKVELSDFFDASAKFGAEGIWKSNQCTCAYVFSEGTLNFTLGGEGKLLKIMIFWPPGVKTTIAPVLTGSASAALKWNALAGAVFPSWPPTGGSGSFTLGGGVSVEVELLAGLLKGTGTGLANVTTSVNFPPKPANECAVAIGHWCYEGYCFELQFTVEAGWGILKGTHTKKWGPTCAPPPTPIMDVNPYSNVVSEMDSVTLERYLFAGEGDSVEIYEESVYTLEALTGTGSVYEGISVLADISADLLNDGVPSAAISGSGEALVVWTKDQAADQLGATVQASTWGGTTWNTPVAVSGSVEFHKDPVVVFDSSDNPMAIWSRALNDGLDWSTSTVEEILAAFETADIVYSQRSAGVWSSPVTLSSLAGRDEQTAIAAGPSGQMTAAWINELAGVWLVYASIWNGSSWSTPAELASAVGAQQPSVTYTSGQPIVVWAQDVDEDTESFEDWRIFSSSWDGSVWSDPEQVALQGTKALGPQSVLDDAGISGTPNASIAAVLSSIPAPPPECCTGSCDDPVPPDSAAGGGQQETRAQVSSPVVASADPNEKVGPTGGGAEQSIDAGDRLGYVVYFENKAAASAAAQEVFVTDCLDHDLDWTTLTFDEIAFGDLVVGNSSGESLFDTRVTIPDHRSGEDKEWWVDVTSEFDLGTGCLDVTFRTLDPATGELPEDVFSGFLPPEDGTGRGQGHIALSVDSKSDLADGTVITNLGTIVFDVNEAIVTNEWYNTIGMPVTPLLTVTVAGSGGGTVISYPVGIDCGSDCYEFLTAGTLVELVATPDSGTIFGGWLGGGCSGTDLECEFTLNQSTSVHAIFEPEGTCGLCDSMVLEQMTIEDSHVFEACTTITAGNDLDVTSTANVTLTAGEKVVMTNGFSLESGASLTVDIDPGVGSP